MHMRLLKFYLLVGIIAVAGCNKGEEVAEAPEAAEVAEVAEATEEKPTVSEEVIVTMEATVTAVNQETREVTLKNSEGESITIIADEEVRNLAQVDVGDKLTVEYMEGVMIQVVAPEAELGAIEVAGADRAKLGDKPAGVAATVSTIVVVIEKINKEKETVTLKNAEGESKTVKVRNPDNLEKVAVGDKIMITFTEAIAISVTEK